MKKLFAVSLILFTFIFPILTFADSTITTANSDAGDHTAVCYSAGDTAKVGVAFIADANGTISSVSVTINKSGSPTSTLSIGIQADSSGHPSGSYLGSGTKIASDITTSFVNYIITLDTPVAVTSGVTYWVVASCDSLSSSNYYQWEGSVVNGNLTKHLDTATWNNFNGFYAYSTILNTFGGGGGGGTTFDTTTATSTTDQTQQNIAWAFIIFFVGLLLVKFNFK